MSLISVGNPSQFQFEEKMADPEVAKSYLGTNVVDNLVIEAGEYIDPELKTNVAYAGIRIDAVLFNVLRPKRVVSTEVLGRQGTVNQYITLGDYLVDINVILNGRSTERSPGVFDMENIGSQAPFDDMAKLLVIMNAPAAIPVTSRFLGVFGITDLIFTEYTVPQRTGSWNSQEIRIRARSENLVNLEGQTF